MAKKNSGRRPQRFTESAIPSEDQHVFSDHIESHHPVTLRAALAQESEKNHVSQTTEEQDESVTSASGAESRTDSVTSEESAIDGAAPSARSKSKKAKGSASKVPTTGLRQPQHTEHRQLLSVAIPASPSSNMATRPASLLVASLGNPPPYHSTRHSAAHIVLRALQSSMNLPSFAQKSKPYGGGHVSVGADAGRPEFTLYQSSVQMNVSGPPLLKAWKHFAGQQDFTNRIPGLVVLHDEMEIQPGSIKVRRGNGSAKGHNGIKSVQNSFSEGGVLDALGDRFVKIAIGVGRPAGGSRQSNDVSAYVLGQLTSREKQELEAVAGQIEGVLYQELARIQQSS